MNDDNSSSLPPQTFTGHDRLILPDKQELLGAYKGYHVSNLRTPAFIVDRSIVEHNCAGMLASTKSLKAKFRAHVKTHKTIEVLRLQLSSGGHTSQSVVVSTLMEAWNIVNESSDGLVKDLLYGLPVPINKIADIWDLTMSFQNDDRSFRLLVDHPDQVKGLLAFWHTQPDGPYLFNPRWSLFVKVDADYKRAGVVPDTPEFHEIVNLILDHPRELSLHGFYCHAGNSYSSKSPQDASLFLTAEMLCVDKAAWTTQEIMAKRGMETQNLPPFVLSVGSTPTAHASSFSEKKVEEMQKLLHGELEIHAGNYVFHDLQQQATSLISPEKEIAFRVLATVVSHYKGRGVDGTDEVMVDVGGIGMSKDTGPIEGWGNVVAVIAPPSQSSSTTNTPSKWMWNKTGWRLGRISQEHGILVHDSSSGIKSPPLPPIGSIVAIIGQHACLTAANHPWYYVVDSSLPAHEEDNGRVGERVVDMWVPWKGW